MALIEIALLKWQTNVSLVSEDCWFAVQLSRRIWGKSRSYLKNFDYRYCLLTTWIKHCFKKVNVFEPVPFSADRQQQFYLYQLL